MCVLASSLVRVTDEPARIEPWYCTSRCRADTDVGTESADGAGGVGGRAGRGSTRTCAAAAGAAGRARASSAGAVNCGHPATTIQSKLATKNLDFDTAARLPALRCFENPTTCPVDYVEVEPASRQDTARS